jgi:hypothetical protein
MPKPVSGTKIILSRYSGTTLPDQQMPKKKSTADKIKDAISAVGMKVRREAEDFASTRLKALSATTSAEPRAANLPRGRK